MRKSENIIKTFLKKRYNILEEHACLWALRCELNITEDRQLKETDFKILKIEMLKWKAN